MIHPYVTLAIQHSGHLFIAGMLFYFYLRQLYIAKVVMILSPTKHDPDYLRVRRKARILSLMQIINLFLYGYFYVPELGDKIIFVNEEWVILRVAAVLVVMFSIYVAGGEFAKWLVHDDDFNEQLTKKHKS